jgi:2OG-Fe(II) oxygenase superfamily
MRMDESLFRERELGEQPKGDTIDHGDKINEDTQIVRYQQGQQYTAHHDFSYPQGPGKHKVRAINLCMYLNNVKAGGQTSFPR